MCDTCCRKPFHCIVPPHMLRVLELRGDARQSEMARALLSQSRTVREERAAAVTARPMLRSRVAGGVFEARSFVAGAPERRLNREIYSGEEKATLPGKLLRAEGDAATGDAAADAAYDGAGAVYDFYFDTFARDSIDGQGMKRVSTVHHRRRFNNAFWEGAQMAYGDGDGQIFSSFIETSVIGHEMSHGVVQFSGGLEYQGQSGALNESFADVFGSMIASSPRRPTSTRATGWSGRGSSGRRSTGWRCAR